MVWCGKRVVQLVSVALSLHSGTQKRSRSSRAQKRVYRLSPIEGLLLVSCAGWYAPPKLAKLPEVGRCGEPIEPVPARSNFDFTFCFDFPDGEPVERGVDDEESMLPTALAVVVFFAASFEVDLNAAPPLPPTTNDEGELANEEAPLTPPP